MAATSSLKLAVSKKQSGFVDFFKRLVREKPLGTVGFVITVLLLAVGIFANVIAPYGMNEIHAGPTMIGPAIGYPLGTDVTGRDMLSRIIYGAQISVIVGLAGSTLATIIMVIIGMLSGYIGGRFDMIMQRFVDGFMCFPSLILLIALMSIIGPGLWQVIIVLGVQQGIICSRIVRGSTLSVKENVYVQAAVSIGCSRTRVLYRHVMPNIMATIIVMFFILVPFIILAEASLSFLGFGVPPPAPSWGGMLSGSGREYMFRNPWLVVWPGIAISIVVYGVNVFGDAVRDILDPRLRGGVGRFGVKVKNTTAL
jgi:peptide/nickel transport system permease protein